MKDQKMERKMEMMTTLVTGYSMGPLSAERVESQKEEMVKAKTMVCMREQTTVGLTELKKEKQQETMMMVELLRSMTEYRMVVKTDKKRGKIMEIQKRQQRNCEKGAMKGYWLLKMMV